MPGQRASSELRRGGRPGATDLVTVLWANARIVAATIAVDPNAWRRYLRLVIDGLRAEAAHPIPEPPMHHDQIDQARLALGGGR